MGHLIKVQTTIIIFVMVVSLAYSQDSTIVCHYSCKECVGESYTLCTVCVGDRNITVVEDPTVSDAKYINSNIPSGVCTGDIPPKANALGVILIIACSAIAAVVRTPSSIYLISTLQTLSLLSFIQIAWVSPVGYLLQSLQYFMIFNWMGTGYKIPDQTMRERQYYRLDLYMRESGFLRNFGIVGLVDLVVFGVMVGVVVLKYRKDRKQRQQAHMQIISQKSQKLQQASIQPPQPQPQPLLQNPLQLLLQITTTSFYLLIQQSCLTILTSLRFQRPLPLQTKIIPIIYCIFLLLFLIYTYFQKLWFFPNLQVQFLGIWRKIGLAVLVVVPTRVSYLGAVGLFGFVVLESFFDYKGGNQKLLSRLTLFKLIQLITVVMAGAYILTELTRNIQLQTNIIRVFLAIAIIALFICFFIELFFGIIETYCKIGDGSVRNENQGEGVGEGEGEKNVFQGEYTIQNIAGNQGMGGTGKKTGLVVEDIEDQQLEGDNGYADRDRLKNSLKVSMTNKNDTAKVGENEKQKASKSENTDESDKEAKRKKELLKQQQQQEQKARLAKEKQQEQARKRKEQQQLQALKRKQSQARKKKEQQQLQALKKKQQEQALKKKQKQQQQAREKFQAEEAARQKKQQEQWQAKQKQRRRRKHESQMDPELRKRYGM